MERPASSSKRAPQSDAKKKSASSSNRTSSSKKRPAPPPNLKGRRATPPRLAKKRNDPPSRKPVAVTKKAGRRVPTKSRKEIHSSSTDDDDEDTSPPPSKRRKSSSGKSIIADSDVDSETGVPTAMFATYAGTNPMECDNAFLAQHRSIFMQRAFPENNEDDDSLEVEDRDHKNRQSSLRTEEDLERICYVLKYWGGDTNLKFLDDEKLKKQLSKFRREHAYGKHWAGQYTYSMITLPSGEKRKILRRLEGKNKEVGRIVVSKERIFDAINEWHRDGGGHFGSERTWTHCREKYWNCTQNLVRLFCELCPECFSRNPRIKTVKGSRKPIKSKKFRERFQIDLIDMRKLRKRNPYGVLMRWVITIKDHATGYTMIDCIPRKTARNVAHVLQLFFGHIGYPFIFHTDNGKEFVGKEILECLRQISPSILTVHGRPHVPRDQGSVENMNKTVKRVMQAELAERRLKGDNCNWTEILGSIASSVNSQCGRGKNEVPSYNAVFGYTYHQDVNVTKEEARQCWTVKERLPVRYTTFVMLKLFRVLAFNIFICLTYLNCISCPRILSTMKSLKRNSM